MKNLRFLTVSVLMLALMTFSAFSKKDVFSVLAVKGNVQYKTDGAWSKVMTGGNLPLSAVVKLESGSYLGLVFSNGNTAELKKAGEYSLKDIQGKLKDGKGELSSKLADYVMNEISSSKDLLSSENYRNNMETLGSVERAVEMDVLAKRQRIPVKSPFKSDIISGKITLTWMNTPGVDEYKLQITDLFNTVFTETTADTNFVLNASSANLDRGVYYFWTVSSEKNPEIKSEETCIRFLSDKEAEEINGKLQDLLADVDENSALGKIITAAFYEQNNLIFDAKEQYKDAVAMAPDVDEYLFLYMRFLKRTKMYH